MKKKKGDVHVSHDRRLQDSAPVMIHGQVIIRQVSYWIEIAPVKLWLAIKLQKLSLSTDAYSALKERMQQVRPDLVRHSDLRKTVYRAKASVVEKHVSPLEVKLKLVSRVFASAEDFIKHEKLHGVTKTKTKILVTKEPIQSFHDPRTYYLP